MFARKNGHALQQTSRVGHPRSGIDFVCRTRLDNLTGVHHGHPVGDAGHDAQVVRNEEQRHAELLLKVGKQFEDLCLHRHVERSGRFVSDEQVGLSGQRHGDHDALPHAPREFMRVIVEALVGLRDADQLHQFEGPPARHFLRDLLVRADGLRNLRSDPEERVQARHRLLEDHGHARTVQAASLPGGQRPEILPPEADAATRNPAGGRRPITLRHVTVLPEPDSPTTASVSPASTYRSTPRTTSSGPSGVSNATCRFSISRTRSVMGAGYAAGGGRETGSTESVADHACVS